MKPPYRYGLINGIIIGIFTLSFFSVFNWFNSKFGWGIQPANIRGIAGLLTILIQAVGIYIGISNVKLQQGTITYGEAFKTGFTMAIVTALVVSLFSLIYITIINPGYTDYMVNEAHKTMLADGETPAQIQKSLIGVRKEFSLGIQLMQSLVGQSVIGTAISLMIAPFIKTKKSL